MQNLQKSIRKAKQKTKITYYSELLHKYETDSKRTWQVMKEITGKQNKINLLPQENKLDKTIIKNPQDIVKEFKKIFTFVVPKFAENISNTEKTFKHFVISHNEKMQFEELNFEEFGKAFKILKTKL